MGKLFVAVARFVRAAYAYTRPIEPAAPGEFAREAESVRMRSTFGGS